MRIPSLAWLLFTSSCSSFFFFHVQIVCNNSYFSISFFKPKLVEPDYFISNTLNRIDINKINSKRNLGRVDEITIMWNTFLQLLEPNNPLKKKRTNSNEKKKKKLEPRKTVALSITRVRLSISIESRTLFHGCVTLFPCGRSVGKRARQRRRRKAAAQSARFPWEPTWSKSQYLDCARLRSGRREKRAWSA